MAKTLREFFPDRISNTTSMERVISPRFPAFRAHAVDEESAARIRAAATSTRIVKGSPVREIDGEANMLGLICACVDFPDLQDAELQAAWGVMGAEALVRKMLLPGEYAELSNFVAELCGFDRDMESLVGEAKNS